MIKRLILGILSISICSTSFAEQLMYIGTLDKKLLVIDEDKEAVVNMIPLGGIPRTTVLSADHSKIYVLSTQMLLETVDLASGKVVSSFSLGDARSKPRMRSSAPDVVNLGNAGRYTGLVADPAGNFLYTTMKVVVKDIDQYRIEAPQFVAIDLKNQRIAKAWPFPEDMDQGFGFNATYKVSPDSKYLYVFQEDILVWDLEKFELVDRIPLGQPPYPGASPYHLAAAEDSFDTPDQVTSVFTSVDPIVHKGTLGMATIDLNTREVDYTPIGPMLPMLGFQLAPDRKHGISVMPKIGLGANRLTEWWLWDTESHSVIRKQEFETRPTFKFAIGGTGEKLYLYGAGSSLEVWDAETLQSRKLIELDRDTTTNLIPIPAN